MTGEHPLVSVRDHRKEQLADLRALFTADPGPMRRAWIRYLAWFALTAAVVATGFGWFLSFVGSSGERARDRVRLRLEPHDLVVLRSDFLGEDTPCSLSLAYSSVDGRDKSCTASLSCDGRTLHQGESTCSPFPDREGLGDGVIYEDGALGVAYGYEVMVALRDESGFAQLAGLLEYEGEITKLDAQAHTLELADGQVVLISGGTSFQEGDASRFEDIPPLLGSSGTVRVVVGAVWTTHRGRRIHHARTLRVERL